MEETKRCLQKSTRFDFTKPFIGHNIDINRHRYEPNSFAARIHAPKGVTAAHLGYGDRADSSQPDTVVRTLSRLYTCLSPRQVQTSQAVVQSEIEDIVLATLGA